MVDLRQLSSKAKELLAKRGGTESVKEDASELGGIAKGPGSLQDKAKAAVEAIKDPGADSVAADVQAEAPEPTSETARRPGPKNRGGRGGGGGQGRGGGGQGRRGKREREGRRGQGGGGRAV